MFLYVANEAPTSKGWFIGCPEPPDSVCGIGRKKTADGPARLIPLCVELEGALVNWLPAARIRGKASAVIDANGESEAPT